MTTKYDTKLSTVDSEYATFKHHVFYNCHKIELLKSALSKYFIRQDGSLSDMLGIYIA